MMLHPYSTQYYLENRFSDVEVVHFLLFDISLEQILLANKQDGNNIKDFSSAAEKALKIVDNAAKSLNLEVSNWLLDAE